PLYSCATIKRQSSYAQTTNHAQPTSITSYRKSKIENRTRSQRDQMFVTLSRERGHPSRGDGMFILTWHMRLTGHHIRYPDITLRPYRTRHLHAHGFYKHCVPTGRWSYDRASVILRFHPQRRSTPNQKSQIDTQ